jgi:mRNA interferase RelE/StbE
VSETYEVKLSRRALRSLVSLERSQQQRIRAALDLLAENPRPPNCVALRGEDSVYRVRIGDYRIVYEVRDLVLLVHVVRTGASHR